MLKNRTVVVVRDAAKKTTVKLLKIKTPNFTFERAILSVYFIIC